MAPVSISGGFLLKNNRFLRKFFRCFLEQKRGERFYYAMKTTFSSQKNKQNRRVFVRQMTLAGIATLFAGCSTALDNCCDKKATKLLLMEIKANSADVSAVLLASIKEIAATRKDPGNISCVLLRFREESAHFFFLEKWKDQKAIADHFSTQHMRDFLTILDKNADGVRMSISDIGTGVIFEDEEIKIPGWEKDIARSDTFAGKVILAKAVAKSGTEDALSVIANRCVVETRKEDGCLSYGFFDDAANPGSFLFLESWKDQAAIDAHGKTPHFKQFIEDSKELLAENLEVQVLDISRVVRFHRAR